MAGGAACSSSSAAPISPPRCKSRRSTSLYRDADEFGIGEDADFRCAHFHPRRAEVAHEESSDAVGESLHQAEVAAGGELADAQRHLLVVDRVGDLVA